MRMRALNGVPILGSAQATRHAGLATSTEVDVAEKTGMPDYVALAFAFLLFLLASPAFAACARHQLIHPNNHVHASSDVTARNGNGGVQSRHPFHRVHTTVNRQRKQ